MNVKPKTEMHTFYENPQLSLSVQLCLIDSFLDEQINLYNQYLWFKFIVKLAVIYELTLNLTTLYEM